MSKVMAGRSTDPSDNLKMKPPKGILKSSSSFEAPDAPGGSRKSQKNSKETTFDEMNILETLHPPGKDYGHMKIDEPKTPYERDVPDAVGVDPDDLAKRMREESEKPRRELPLMEEDSGGEEDLSPEDREKKRQFEMKRKAHYNEYLMAKKKLQELKDEDDDDDD
ncbi:protein phosphatase inhibitor 2 [Halyomorpha halys]|uniref:protein phosphatase inhibitor 2 n=1 Tax=Halyomorpha halys TaxID=286706 RepID=UPI0006D510A6|nr:protein phosphatase inhibitor 2-like [Halyomorpha halys]